MDRDGRAALRVRHRRARRDGVAARPGAARIHNAVGAHDARRHADGVGRPSGGRGADAARLRPGPDARALPAAAERGWSSFFYGGEDGVPEQLAERLTARVPGLRVAGTYSPPFRPLTPDEDAADRRADQPLRRRPGVGRPEHAQAGALDGGPCRAAATPGAARRRRRLRHPRRDARPGPALDAAHRAWSGSTAWVASRAACGGATCPTTRASWSRSSAGRQSSSERSISDSSREGAY